MQIKVMKYENLQLFPPRLHFICLFSLSFTQQHSCSCKILLHMCCCVTGKFIVIIKTYRALLMQYIRGKLRNQLKVVMQDLVLC